MYSTGKFVLSFFQSLHFILHLQIKLQSFLLAEIFSSKKGEKDERDVKDEKDLKDQKDRKEGGAAEHLGPFGLFRPFGPFRCPLAVN